MENNRGIIYILTNDLFKDNIIKIGMTEEDVIGRIKQLNSGTGVPYPFSCYAAFEIDNYKGIEKIVYFFNTKHIVELTSIHTKKKSKMNSLKLNLARQET